MNIPIFAVLSRCVPPQNSSEYSPILTTRTVSPYFSPKSAVAPSFCASAIGSTCVVMSTPCKTISITADDTFASSSGVTAEKCVKSKRR